MKKTVVTALSILALICIWLLSGLLSGGGEKPQAQQDQQEVLTRVRYRTIEKEQKRIDIKLHGRTEARRIVDVTAEIAGKVVSTRVEKGQRVKKGDVLCELAEEDRRVQLSRAMASFEKARIDYEGAQKLFDDGMISSATIAGNKSELENARAALKQAELKVSYLTMRAPFDAFVEDRPAQVGALIERNGICARLLDESSLLAAGYASERIVHQLQLGQPASVRLSGGREMTGRVSFIGRTADPVTRTYRIEVELKLDGQPVRDGITADIVIPVRTETTHRITPALLALDAEGGLGVRLVNDRDIVEWHAVDVVSESIDGVWLTGLPLDKPVKLITVGQELVTPGEKVEAISVEQIEAQQQEKLQ